MAKPNALTLLGLLLATHPSARADEKPPLTEEERGVIARRLDETIAVCTNKLKSSPEDVRLLLARGSANSHRARFKESLADFDRIVQLDPKRGPQLWQRGITLYFLKDYKSGARQFEIYLTVDNVDRENGIWHFMCRAQLDGMEAAAKAMLPYKAIDRAPFPDLYDLFAGRTTAKAVLENVRSANVPEPQRQKQLFDAHQYLGYHALVRKDRLSAIEHLRHAVANSWARNVENGPTYMWHVARVQYELLIDEPQIKETPASDAP